MSCGILRLMPRSPTPARAHASYADLPFSRAVGEPSPTDPAKGRSGSRASSRGGQSGQRVFPVIDPLQGGRPRRSRGPATVLDEAEEVDEEKVITSLWIWPCSCPQAQRIDLVSTHPIPPVPPPGTSAPALPRSGGAGETEARAKQRRHERHTRSAPRPDLRRGARPVTRELAAQACALTRAAGLASAHGRDSAPAR